VILRSRGKLEPVQLDQLRALWLKNLATLPWVADAFQLSEVNVHWSFSTGWDNLKHRCEYDYRHPLQDFAKYLENVSLDAVDDYQRGFLESCEFMQGVRTARSLGSLSPGKVAAVLEELDDEAEWTRVRGVVVVWDRFTDDGVHVIVYDTMDDEVLSQWWDCAGVRLFNPRPHRFRWCGSVSQVTAL
jgi:hypothetical protein